MAERFDPGYVIPIQARPGRDRGTIGLPVVPIQGRDLDAQLGQGTAVEESVSPGGSQQHLAFRVRIDHRDLVHAAIQLPATFVHAGQHRNLAIDAHLGKRFQHGIAVRHGTTLEGNGGPDTRSGRHRCGGLSGSQQGVETQILGKRESGLLPHHDPDPHPQRDPAEGPVHLTVFQAHGGAQAVFEKQVREAPTP